MPPSPQRLGYVFKKGDRGVGYYADRPSVWRGKAARPPSNGGSRLASSRALLSPCVGSS